MNQCYYVHDYDGVLHRCESPAEWSVHKMDDDGDWDEYTDIYMCGAHLQYGIGEDAGYRVVRYGAAPLQLKPGTSIFTSRHRCGVCRKVIPEDQAMCEPCRRDSYL